MPAKKKRKTVKKKMPNSNPIIPSDGSPGLDDSRARNSRVPLPLTLVQGVPEKVKYPMSTLASA
jgi:hypothetical protein